MVDRDFEAELASLELDDSEPYNGLDTSVASSQLTDFLVQHGVLSPSRASRDQLAALSSSSSSSPSSSPYRAPAAAATTTTRNLKTTNPNTSTPERRNLATRLHAAGLNGYDPHTAPSFRGNGDNNNDTLNQTPRSGISSLGLASPPRHPYQPIMQGTGGEALPPPRRPLDTPAAATAAAAAAAAAAAPPPSASASSSSSWEVVNRLLRQEGYRTVSGRDEPTEVLGVLRQVLRDRRELGELLKTYQLERQRRDNEQRMVEGRLEGVKRAKGSLNETLQAAEDQAKALRAEVEKARREGAEGVREAKVKNTQLLAKLRQSEHRVKMREAHIDKMNSKLEAMVAREAKEKEHQKDVLRRLQQREPRPSDGKLLEVVGALEGARQRGTEEIKGLKEEVAGLNDALKEKENYIARREGRGAWVASSPSPVGKKKRSTTSTTTAAAAAAGGGGGPGMQQLLEQVQKQEQALRHATKKEQALAQKVTAGEEEKARLQGEGERLEGENIKLKADLKGRPTLKAWKASQKQVDHLEARLKKALQEARDATSAAASSAAMRQSSNSSSTTTTTTTKQQQQHEKILSEICDLLSLPFPSLAPPTIARLTEAMSVIPTLESFVKDVCTFLARATLPHGQHLSPDEAVRRMPMTEALKALKVWAKELQNTREVRRFRSRVRTIVSNRGGKGGEEEEEEEEGTEDEEEEDDDGLLGKVAMLVGFEAEVLASREAGEQVEGYLATRPDILVNRVVQHFRQLFQVKSLEGLFPKMNELYLFTSEMAVFMRVLKSMLRLPATCPTNTLLTALQKAIRRARTKGKQARSRELGSRRGEAVLEGVPEEDEEEEEEGGVVEESVLVDGGVQRNEHEDEEQEGEEEDEEEEDGSISDSSFLSEPRRPAYLPQYDDSSMMSGAGSEQDQDEDEDEVTEEDTSILSTATSASSASSSSTSSSLSAAPSTRPSGEQDVSVSMNAADQSSISNVDFRLLGVLSAAESRSRDSPFPAPRAWPSMALPSVSSSPSSSSVASSSVSSSVSWTRPLPGGAASRRTTTTGGFGGSSSSAMRGFSSSAASTGTGLLGVLSFAESGDVAAFPTPAKAEDLRYGNRRSFASSM